jgi:hypothetical protein
MRFWRSFGLLALALGILSMPAHAAGKKKGKAPKTANAAVAADTTAAASQAAKSSAKKKSATHSHKPVRRAWMLGYGAGWGRADFAGSGRIPFTYPGTYISTQTISPDSNYYISEYDQNRLAPLEQQWGPLSGLQVAYAIRQSLSVGFETPSWSQDISGDTWKVRMSVVTASWYPDGGQFYVRGGFGLGAVTAKDNYQHVISTTKRILTAPAPPVPIVSEREYSRLDDGIGLIAATGYEWSVYKRLALAPEVRFAYLTLTDRVFLHMFDASLAARWWF